MYEVRIANTEKELEAIFQLRYKILRAPWNQSYESASDELENTSVNAYIQNEKAEVIACGRLQENEGKIGQVRYMAVEPLLQGKGLGKKILVELEEQAKTLGFNSIELQARENALQFYKKNGYTIKEKTFLLWGRVQHYLMEKAV